VDLYVVRHGEAGAAHPQRWPDDRARPLTAEGVEAFRRAAWGIGRVVPRIDQLLSSSLVRAWSTAEILHQEAGWPAPEPCEPLSRNTPAGELLARVLLPNAGLASLALVGHEPSMSELVAYLLGAPTGGVAMEKGAVAYLRMDAVQPGGARLCWLAVPDLLAGIEM
jgi:phosphohistidine phosphatase